VFCVIIILILIVIIIMTNNNIILTLSYVKLQRHFQQQVLFIVLRICGVSSFC